MQVNVGPYAFPVTAKTFNFASVIFGGVTILAILSFSVVPPRTWLSNERMELMYEASSNEGPIFHEGRAGNEVA